MMIDIAAAREAYKTREISNIGHVPSANNLADGLTKRMLQASLLKLLYTGKLTIEVTQWILRDRQEQLSNLESLRRLGLFYYAVRLREPQALGVFPSHSSSVSSYISIGYCSAASSIKASSRTNRRYLAYRALCATPSTSSSLILLFSSLHYRQSVKPIAHVLKRRHCTPDTHAIQLF
eukprot:IDg6992t1